MKAVGIVCEYNPFHNGHRYQIAEAKAISGADAVVCVMSGSFVQRGEVALFDKWARAKCALESGADLVIELPVWYVLQSAEMFAYGAVNLLAKSRLADTISFGTETDDIALLKECGAVLAGEGEALKEEIRALMAKGEGYPSALRKGVAVMHPHLAKIIDTPNSMLGASYISAMIKCGMSPDGIVPVKRLSAPHDSDTTDGVFASSSYLRKIIEDGGDTSHLSPFDTTLPRYCMKNLDGFILGSLRTASPDRLRRIPGIEEGFENRLIDTARKSATLDELFEKASSKRYTVSRVKRTVLASVIGMEEGRECDYVRVLGMTDTGAALIKSVKETSSMEIVTKTADFKPKANSTFPYDILATDIAALSCEDTRYRTAGRDYFVSPVKI